MLNFKQVRTSYIDRKDCFVFKFSARLRWRALQFRACCRGSSVPLMHRDLCDLASQNQIQILPKERTDSLCTVKKFTLI